MCAQHPNKKDWLGRYGLGEPGKALQIPAMKEFIEILRVAASCTAQTQPHTHRDPQCKCKILYKYTDSGDVHLEKTQLVDKCIIDDIRKTYILYSR